jgi:hypothetical protein
MSLLISICMYVPELATEGTLSFWQKPNLPPHIQTQLCRWHLLPSPSYCFSLVAFPSVNIFSIQLTYTCISSNLNIQSRIMQMVLFTHRQKSEYTMKMKTPKPSPPKIIYQYIFSGLMRILLSEKSKIAKMFDNISKA